MAGTRAENNWPSRTEDQVASTGHAYLRNPAGNQRCIFRGV